MSHGGGRKHSATDMEILARIKRNRERSHPMAERDDLELSINSDYNLRVKVDDQVSVFSMHGFPMYVIEALRQRLRAPVEPPVDPYERPVSEARSTEEINKNLYQVLDEIQGTVEWVSEASALQSDVTDAAWDLLEAITDACVEPYGGVGHAAEKLRSALEDTKEKNE